VNFPKVTSVNMRYAADDSLEVVEKAFLVLFSWQLQFHKQCEMEIAMLWPGHKQMGCEMAFHVLPELSSNMLESDWPQVQWWC
jgi:hypothetical protein